MLGILNMAGNALRSFGSIHPAIKWGVIAIVGLLAVEFVGREGIALYRDMAMTQLQIRQQQAVTDAATGSPYVVIPGDKANSPDVGTVTTNAETDTRRGLLPVIGSLGAYAIMIFGAIGCLSYIGSSNYEGVLNPPSMLLQLMGVCATAACIFAIVYLASTSTHGSTLIFSILYGCLLFYLVVDTQTKLSIAANRSAGHEAKYNEVLKELQTYERAQERFASSKDQQQT